ncbi:MAG: hypothetical protein ACLP4R_27565 [Solirubrobacteraceae bacterium]
MSVPTAELTAPAPSTDVAARARTLTALFGGWRFYLWLGGVALVIGAISLLIPSTPSYDPWAWLVWGREITHLDLHLIGGPSWKPLPMIFTTIFAIFGKAQPDLWLVVARAGAVMALVMVFRIAWRVTRDLGGAASEKSAWRYVPLLLAGLIAAGSLVNSGGFISDNALGYSEGLATALMLIAVERYMDGAPRQALVVSFFSALDRPELWVFWGPYALYVFWRDPGARRLVVALAALIFVLWFLFPLWGAGSLLAGITRALHPRSNSAAFTSCPVCTVFKQEAWPEVLNRVKIPAILGLIAAAVGLWRTRGSWWGKWQPSRDVSARAWLLGIGLFGFVWWFGIALETQLGFSGNGRYLVLGTAPVAIAGGIAWGWFAQTVPRAIRSLAARAPSLRRLAGARGSYFALPAGCAVAIALFLAIPPWISKNVISLPRTHRALLYQAHLREDLGTVISRLGGPAAIRRCGPIMVEGFQVPMVAYALGVRTLQVEAQPTGLVGPPWPNTILQDRDTSSAALLPSPQQILAWEHDGARYSTFFHERTFYVFSTCASKAGDH